MAVAATPSATQAILFFTAISFILDRQGFVNRQRTPPEPSRKIVKKRAPSPNWTGAPFTIHRVFVYQDSVFVSMMSTRLPAWMYEPSILYVPVRAALEGTVTLKIRLVA